MLRAHVMPACRQGPYTGWKPDRIERRHPVAYGCTVESTPGWHRGLITLNGRVVERLKAVRNRRQAMALACARMIELKETSLG